LGWICSKGFWRSSGIARNKKKKDVHLSKFRKVSSRIFTGVRQLWRSSGVLKVYE
jgi:hypothetical protein